MIKRFRKLCWALLVFMIVAAIQLPGNKTLAVSNGVQDRLKNAVVLYLGSPKAYVNNSETRIDPTNPDIIPVTRGGRTLVPVRFISENFGGTVDWDNATMTVTVTIAKKVIKLTLGSNKMYIDNREILLDVPAQSIGGRVYIPLRRLAEDALGKKVFFDRGLIILCDNENIFDKSFEKRVD